MAEPIIDLCARADGLALAAPGGGGLRAGELADQVSRLADGLSERGIGPGDAIGLIGPNGPELAVAFLAVASVAAAAPLNPVVPGPELTFEVRDLGLRAVLVVGGPAPMGVAGWPDPVVATAERAGVTVLRLDPDPAGPAGAVVLRGPCLSARRDPGDADEPRPSLDADVALLLHTSGTTARPKSVPLTRANLAASAASVAASLDLTPDDVGLEVMPLFHVHGLVAGLLAPLLAGSTVICTPGFHAPEVVGWLSQDGPLAPTWITAVPTMHLGLVERFDATARASRPGRLRLLRSSSAPLAPQLLARVEQAWGAPVIEAYGMTEASHQISSNPLPPRERRPGTVGRPAGCEVAIRVDGPGRSGWGEPGEVGEIVIRGANVIRGYRTDDPSVDRDAFIDGWFRTGDEGHLDPDGDLTITGRLKEIINRGGEKIAPREVDEVLLDHPAVAQAVTFAVPDARLGESVAAAVVAAAGATPVERDLRHFVAQRLAVHKVPRHVVVLDELPQGATGKLNRVGLAARLGLDGRAEEGASGNPDADAGDDDTPSASPEVVGYVTDRWVEVLGLAHPPAPDQHFLDVGGDSMGAARLLAILRDQLALEVSALDLFDRPTVASQARWVEDLLDRDPDR